MILPPKEIWKRICQDKQAMLIPTTTNPKDPRNIYYNNRRIRPVYRKMAKRHDGIEKVV